MADTLSTSTIPADAPFGAATEAHDVPLGSAPENRRSL